MNKTKEKEALNFCKAKKGIYQQIIHYLEMYPNTEEKRLIALIKVFIGLSQETAEECIQDLTDAGIITKSMGKLSVIKRLEQIPFSF